MKINKHTTSMTPHQRGELIRILKMFHDMNELAVLTDPELHELWVTDCEYDNPYKKEGPPCTTTTYEDLGKTEQNKPSYE